ncbi:MAG: glycosyltransferase family 4 protein [Candidatus Zixiibacteriota bacterium]
MGKRGPEIPSAGDKSPKGRRVLIVAPRLVASFTRQDAQLLSHDFEVELHAYRGWRSILELRRRIAESDLVFVWFAGRHSAVAALLARLRGLPLVIVIGGYEAVWIPEINYGVRPGSPSHRILRRILSSARLILTVSEYTSRSLLTSLPDLGNRERMIYNGVNTSDFNPGATGGRECVLCVGIIAAHTITTKGWDLYWQTAAAMPDVSFIAAGPALDDTARRFVGHRPANLTWLGPLHGPELVSAYQRASVCFQGSWHESFSLSVAEAMACGCIPVVTRVGALPEVAGDVGFYLADRTVPSAVSAIRAALAAPQECRSRARERVVSKFSAERRGELLRAEIWRVLREHETP